MNTWVIFWSSNRNRRTHGNVVSVVSPHGPTVNWWWPRIHLATNDFCRSIATIYSYHYLFGCVLLLWFCFTVVIFVITTNWYICISMNMFILICFVFCQMFLSNQLAATRPSNFCESRSCLDLQTWQQQSTGVQLTLSACGFVLARLANVCQRNLTCWLSKHVKTNRTIPFFFMQGHTGSCSWEHAGCSSCSYVGALMVYQATVVILWTAERESLLRWSEWSAEFSITSTIHWRSNMK